jgi:hypothetical protein
LEVIITSSIDETNARMRVERLAMMRTSMASRYGRPGFQ